MRISMKKLGFAAAAIFVTSMGSSVIAADAAAMKSAQKDYKAAVDKAKANFDAAIAGCKKLAEDKQSACYKEARQARRAARDEASDAYTKATGKPEPSPGA